MFGRRLLEGRVVTIYKGHDLSWYTATPGDLGEFGIPAGAFVVICVTNVRPRKGVEVLVESARYLPAEVDVHFLLVGNATDGEKLAGAIAASPRRDHFHVAGYRRDAAALNAACDVSVLPSVKREGLPKTVIEAMAYARTPVVTDSGGSPELVVDGESGLVVPPGDPRALAEAITRLYRDREACREMGRRARELIDTEFRIEDTISNTREFYYQLLGERSPSVGDLAVPGSE